MGVHRVLESSPRNEKQLRNPSPPSSPAARSGWLQGASPHQGILARKRLQARKVAHGGRQKASASKSRHKMQVRLWRNEQHGLCWMVYSRTWRIWNKSARFGLSASDLARVEPGQQALANSLSMSATRRPFSEVRLQVARAERRCHDPAAKATQYPLDTAFARYAECTRTRSTEQRNVALSAREQALADEPCGKKVSRRKDPRQSGGPRLSADGELAKTAVGAERHRLLPPVNHSSKTRIIRAPDKSFQEAKRILATLRSSI
jgi:hypothetical protein